MWRRGSSSMASSRSGPDWPMPITVIPAFVASQLSPEPKSVIAGHHPTPMRWTLPKWLIRRREGFSSMIAWEMFLLLSYTWIMRWVAPIATDRILAIMRESSLGWSWCPRWQNRKRELPESSQTWWINNPKTTALQDLELRQLYLSLLLDAIGVRFSVACCWLYYSTAKLEWRLS